MTFMKKALIWEAAFMLFWPAGISHQGKDSNTQTQSLWNKVGDLKKTIASKEKEIQEGKEYLEKLYIHLF